VHDHRDRGLVVSRNEGGTQCSSWRRANPRLKLRAIKDDLTSLTGLSWLVSTEYMLIHNSTMLGCLASLCPSQRGLERDRSSRSDSPHRLFQNNAPRHRYPSVHSCIEHGGTLRYVKADLAECKCAIVNAIRLSLQLQPSKHILFLVGLL
jgi:hypothetical protein